jgi:hypothetical protein
MMVAIHGIVDLVLDHLCYAAVVRMMQLGEICAERHRLTKVWDEALSEFSRAVNSLSDSIGTLTKDEYDKRLANVERIRLTMNNAQRMLDLHRRAHHC